MSAQQGKDTNCVGRRQTKCILVRCPESTEPNEDASKDPIKGMTAQHLLKVKGGF